MFKTEKAVRAFAESLRTVHLGKRIDYRQSAGSTNDLALQAARAGGPHGQVFCAESQKAGRGRRCRNWECPPELGLLFSVIVRPEELTPRTQNDSPPQDELLGPADSGWIPLVTGLACAEAIGSVCGLELAAKWPNDVVRPCAAAPGWKKLGGILCESAVSAGEGQGLDKNSRGYIVIGIGLNANQQAAALPAQARTPPTSILLECGRPCARRKVFRAVLERLEQRLLELFHPAGGPALKLHLGNQLREWWTPQRTLTVQAPGRGGRVGGGDHCGGTVRGRFLGLDVQGRLALQDEAGRRVVFADAEILSVD